MRKKVYICSPYRGNVEKNILFAQKCCNYAIQNDCIPVAPHLYFPQFLDDSNEEERALGMKFAKEALLTCDEVWVCTEQPSKGMLDEILFASKHNIPVKVRKGE